MYHIEMAIELQATTRNARFMMHQNRLRCVMPGCLAAHFKTIVGHDPGETIADGARFSRPAGDAYQLHGGIDEPVAPDMTTYLIEQ